MPETDAGVVTVVGEPQLLEFRRPASLEDFYTLSPYAVYRDGSYEMLLRLVNVSTDPSRKISRIYHATSSDGIVFDVGREVIAPGGRDEPDGAGSEDPTVAEAGTSYSVFYSGYSSATHASSMLMAAGPTLTELRKTGPTLEASPRYANPKEAAILATSAGFRMFFEYARDGASLIGVADARELAGPWGYCDSPLSPRPGLFDSWHMSPASALRRADGTHVLFHNGASKEGAWRISYALLDETGVAVLHRPREPLIAPSDLSEGDSDIAFGASAIVDGSGKVWLYYSIADRKPYRVQLAIEGAIGDSAISNVIESMHE